MIEVNLYSVSPGNPDVMVGRNVARSRFDKDAMGIGVMEFVKGFLRENLGKFERDLGNEELISFINDSKIMSTRDLACVNYLLNEVGYMVMIHNVADDEENPDGVPTGKVIEWNVVDNNFIQNDYPTVTKIIPADGMEIPQILRQIVENSGLFDDTKFAGVKNPFKELLDTMDAIKRTSGSISSSITSKIYSLLDRMGIKVFCAVSED